MKKLLGFLGMITITGSGMAGIIGNAPASAKNEINYSQTNNLKNLNRNKSETISTSDYLEFNNKYIKKMNLTISEKTIINNDSKDNVYFSVDGYKNYVLNNGSDRPFKIDGIEGRVISIDVDNNDNVYFNTISHGPYFLKNGETTAKELISNFPFKSNLAGPVAVDNKNNIYIGGRYASYVLKKGEKNLVTINGLVTSVSLIKIDNKNNVYFVSNKPKSLYVLKSGETTVSKVEGFEYNVNNIVFDNYYNLYFACTNGIFFLKNGEKIPIKITEVTGDIKNIVVDNNNNVYFSMNNIFYFLKNGETKVTKIEKIKENIDLINVDTDNNVYFGTKNGLYIFDKNIIKIISGNIFYIKSSKYNNLYFSCNNNFYFIKNKDIDPKQVKINGITGKIGDIIFDNNDNMYVITRDCGVFFLKKWQTIATKIINVNKIDQFVIDGNNNIYFATNDDNAYFLKNGETKVTKIEGIDDFIKLIFFDSENNVYFYSYNSFYVLKNGETTATKIDGINGANSWTTNNDNIYFGTSNGAYVLKNGETTATKIDGINGIVWKIVIDSQNNVYFGSRDNFYVLKNNEKIIKKIKTVDNDVRKIVIDSQNNVYFSVENTNDFYVLKKDTDTITKIDGISEDITSWIINNNNIIYFATRKGAYFLKPGEKSATKINEINFAYLTFIDNKNNVYFLSDSAIYILDNNFIKKINKEINMNLNSKIIDSENNVYFGTNYGIYIIKNLKTSLNKISNTNSDDSDIFPNLYYLYKDKGDGIYFENNKNLYILYNKLNINNFIKNFNLNIIENNSDKTILNNLNYLNRESNYFLNLNKMKIINKTPTSATIVATKGKYRGEVTVNYKIKNQDEISAIDFNVLVKKAVYFDFFDKNYFSLTKLKEIKDINVDSLMFSEIEATGASDSLKLIDEKSVCFKPVNFSNTSSSGAQKIKVPACSYETKAKYLFQIITGLNTNNSKNKAEGWNLNINDEMTLTDFTSSNKKASEIKNTLSKDFNLSNTNKQEQELILNRDLLHSPEQELSVEPKQRLTAQYVIRLLSIKTNLDLKQKISGTITAKIIDDNNEEQTMILSIKEAMQILQKYSLLPDEITINEDNSITFNGKAIISRTSESDPKPIFNFRPI